MSKEEKQTPGQGALLELIKYTMGQIKDMGFNLALAFGKPEDQKVTMVSSTADLNFLQPAIATMIDAAVKANNPPLQAMIGFFEALKEKYMEQVSPNPCAQSILVAFPELARKVEELGHEANRAKLKMMVLIGDNIEAEYRHSLYFTKEEAASFFGFLVQALAQSAKMSEKELFERVRPNKPDVFN